MWAITPLCTQNQPIGHARFSSSRFGLVCWFLTHASISILKQGWHTAMIKCSSRRYLLSKQQPSNFSYCRTSHMQGLYVPWASRCCFHAPTVSPSCCVSNTLITCEIAINKLYQIKINWWLWWRILTTRMRHGNPMKASASQSFTHTCDHTMAQLNPTKHAHWHHCYEYALRVITWRLDLPGLFFASVHKTAQNGRQLVTRS